MEKPGKDLLDRTWDFFASVRIATVVIFLLAIASVAGTLIEQEGLYSSWKPPAEFYPERYGPLWGTFLFKAGMTRMYTSWWYLSLLFLMGASLVVCSVERFIPLWRVIQKPNMSPPEGFIRHMKHRLAFRPPDGENGLQILGRALRAHRYRVFQTGDRLYADKGRWGRWGPYITHIGLLLILVGGMARAVPGFFFDQSVWIRDGITVKVPNTNWYVRNEKFTVEYYQDGTPRSFRTDAVVVDGGEEVRTFPITMNNPLWYKWVELYQSSYKQELGRASVALTDRGTGETIGSFDLDLTQPLNSYRVGDYEIRIKEYFPDFGFDQGGQPVAKSSEVQNPGFRLEVTSPAGDQFTQWFFVLFPEMEFNTKTPVRFKVLGTEQVSTTGLKVRKDLGIPVIYLGLFIMTAGICCTFYLAHRRIWAMVSGGLVMAGAQTNRNHLMLQSDLQALESAICGTRPRGENERAGEER